jgi:hypothetical protein
VQTLETPVQTKSHVDNHPMVDTLWQSTIQNSRQENPTNCSKQVKTSIVSSKGKIGFETYPGLPKILSTNTKPTFAVTKETEQISALTAAPHEKEQTDIGHSHTD